MTAVSAPLGRIEAASPSAAPADAILSVDDIVKRFETPDGVLTAVDHVSLGVSPGEFLGVIGPSGCGKSTLFNVIGGLLEDYEGRVTVAGERVRGPHPAIGMIFQEEFDLSLAQRSRQRRLPAGDRRNAEGGALRARAALRQAGRARRLRAAAIRRSFPAACASASPWRARSPRNRKSC